MNVEKSVHQICILFTKMRIVLHFHTNKTGGGGDGGGVDDNDDDDDEWKNGSQ